MKFAVFVKMIMFIPKEFKIIYPVLLVLMGIFAQR